MASGPGGDGRCRDRWQAQHNLDRAGPTRVAGVKISLRQIRSQPLRPHLRLRVMATSPAAASNRDDRCPPQVRGVALDMDGLLFDTERLYWQVGQRLLQRRDRQFCGQLQQRMMGRIGVAAMQQMIEFHGLDDDPQDLLAESNAIYSRLLGDGPDPMPGLDQLIDQLTRLQLPFGVATSSKRIFAERILQAQPWYDQLQFLLTGDDVRHGKPHPEMYLTAAAQLQIPAHQMLVLEDSSNGAAAAVAAGAIVIAVPAGATADQPFDRIFASARSLADPVITRTLRGTLWD